MTNVGYIRVSTAQQNIDRPEFKAVMAYLLEGNVLHLHSIDRLALNTADLLNTVNEIKQRGVIVKFHKEGITAGNGEGNAMGNLMLSVLGVVAEMERETTLVRQREGYGAAKAAGRKAARDNGRDVDSKRPGIIKALSADESVRSVASTVGVSTNAVQRIKKEMSNG